MPRQLQCPYFVSSTALPKGNGICYLGMVVEEGRSQKPTFPTKKKVGECLAWLGATHMAFTFRFSVYQHFSKIGEGTESKLLLGICTDHPVSIPSCHPRPLTGHAHIKHPK